jgi:hypothetical protein
MENIQSREGINAKVLSATLAFLLFLPGASGARIADPGFIDAAKNVKAAALEKGLPDIGLPLRLKQAFEQGGKAVWEVNDCGEGGDGRTAPICAEAVIPQQKGYQLHLSVVVGNTEGKKIDKPQIMMIYFIKSEGYKTVDLVRVKTLAEAVRLYKTDLSAKAQ